MCLSISSLESLKMLIFDLEKRIFGNAKDFGSFTMLVKHTGQITVALLR
jgi:hypothetical protein